jgi:anti-sigma B factor antagonist
VGGGAVTGESSGDFRLSELQRRDALVVLRLSGRLDGRAAQLVQRRCDEIRQQGHQNLALELSQVTFLASSGLGVFLAETEEFKEVGGSLHLVAISSVVFSVVNLLNVGRFLSIIPTVQELEATLPMD